MSITTWNIANLERSSTDGYVFTAHWTVNINESTDETDEFGNSVVYSASAYGSIGFERPGELIPFENLTEELVISWIKEKLDVESIESSLLNQIEEQKNPSKLSGTPW